MQQLSGAARRLKPERRHLDAGQRVSPALNMTQREIRVTKALGVTQGSPYKKETAP